MGKKSRKKRNRKKIKNPIQQCPLASCTEVNDCQKIGENLKEGDLVFRSDRHSHVSELIREITGCHYSHVGIVAKDTDGNLVIVDADEKRGKNEDGSSNNSQAVAAITVEKFFCESRATQGLVVRPKNNKASQKAAKWAMEQTKNKEYKYDIWDPWASNKKTVYCSDLVYQAFKNIGINLSRRKLRLFTKKRIQQELTAIRKYSSSKTFNVGDKESLAFFLDDEELEKIMRKKTHNKTTYINPCDLIKGNNIVKFEAPEKAYTSKFDHRRGEVRRLDRMGENFEEDIINN